MEKKDRPQRRKRQMFVRSRMWISYLLSLIARDVGKIPSNIGNNVLITNNLFITKSYMTSVIQVCEMSLDTPVCWTEDIIYLLRSKGVSAIVDYTFKFQKFPIKLKDSGLDSRIRMWRNAAKDDDMSDREKVRAARCLYTVDKVASGSVLSQARVYILVRAKTGSELASSEKIIFDYLTSIGCEFLPITNMDSTLNYIAMCSDFKDKAYKDVQAVVTDSSSLSQMLPNTNGLSKKEGYYLGIDVTSNTHFFLDPNKITLARNIYLIAPSGVGKTVLAMNMCNSALENGSAVCIMDIKGNEFTFFTRAAGGTIVSLRATATEYVNSFRLEKEDSTDENAEMYYKMRMQFSRKQIEILSGIRDQETLNDLHSLTEEFLNTVYVSLGVLPNNRNTWEATKKLNPYVIYDMLVDYLKPEIQRRYFNVCKTLMNQLKVFWSDKGSMSYAFRKEFDYASIMKTPVLTFDFGILEGSSSSVDVNLFRLKFLYMQKLNSEYVTYQHSLGKRTLKILEESQIVDDDIAKSYVEEYTMRRSQMQDTILIGNSVTALTQRDIVAPLVENTRALLIGKLPPDARKVVLEHFDLRGKEKVLDVIGDNLEWSNTFLFVNNMMPQANTPILKVIHDPNDEYDFIKPVKQVNLAVGDGGK